jgi:uncharacterized protein YutE (UPF0331/DUF86 family)
LDRLRETYELQGYEFFIEPLVQMLPNFLGGFRPDAIALKPGDNHVIEVKFGRRPGEERRLETLARLVAGQPGWQLKVFYEAERPEDTLRFTPPTRSQIEAQITEAEQLSEAGHHKAALLLAWAALEALTRARAAQDGAAMQRPFSPAQTVQSLEMAGVIDRRTGQELRVKAQLRNLAAHGDFAAEVDADAVGGLVRLVRRLSTDAALDHMAAGA